MALPASVRQDISTTLIRYCEGRVPAHVRDKVRCSFGIRGSSVTLYEERPLFLRPEEWTQSPVAQFRFGKDGRWTLYCADRNSRWHEYFDAEPLADIRDLLKEVDRDPTGIFWG